MVTAHLENHRGAITVWASRNAAVLRIQNVNMTKVIRCDSWFPFIIYRTANASLRGKTARDRTHRHRLTGSSVTRRSDPTFTDLCFPFHVPFPIEFGVRQDQCCNTQCEQDEQ